MTSPLLIFTRPLALRFSSEPPLSVTGDLPGYASGAVYEGRLQINNPIGDCIVEWLEGSLPPSATIRVDNATQEIVVEWPPYAAPTPLQTDVKNGDLEDGASGLKFGAGWSIGTGGFPTSGTKTAQYDGWGASTIQWPMERCDPGVTITGAVDVQQGASSSGSVGASSYILFFDASGKQIAAAAGVPIFSGSNASWQASPVTGTSPAGTYYAAMAASATRKRQNKPLWVDNARWDLQYPTGTTLDLDYSLTLKVTDSAGRVAYWSGIISEHYVYLTSMPYPVLADDAMTVSPFFVSASSKVSLLSHDQPWEDAFNVAPFFVSALTKQLNWAHTQPAEDFLSVSPFFISASSKEVMLGHTQPQEDNLAVSPFFVGASSKTVLIANAIPLESITVSPFFVSASTT